MSRQTKAERAEIEAAKVQLREWIKPGDTVYTVLESVSRSGMSRVIRVVVPYIDTASCRRPSTDGEGYDSDCECTYGRGNHADAANHRVDFLHPNHSVGLVIGARRAKRGDGLIIGGCGMDMGFHVVYALSHALYGDGYACLGKGRCPSNYHMNHRDRVHCEGVNGERCWRAGGGWSRGETPEGWPRRQVAIGDGQTIDAGPLACVGSIEDGTLQVCPTCAGAGDVPNPAGPERFDLVHTDGYALRHRWL